MRTQLINDMLCEYFATSDITKTQTVQHLWSGYGEIARYKVSKQSLIVKFIDLTNDNNSPKNHPRGWQSDYGHRRKLSSYLNELAFYQHLAALTQPECRVPQFYAGQGDASQLVFIMEDLDAQGFTLRHDFAPLNYDTTPHVTHDLTLHEVSPVAASVIKWLAYFHAQFMQSPTLHSIDISQQWPQGSYWHLATRPDEYAKMPDSSLKRAADTLDFQLRNATYQTLLHGDAKIANFCFSNENDEIAGVDFQYSGRGVGIVDVVYFIGSAFSSQALTTFAPLLLNEYFSHIRHALNDRFEQVQLNSLEQEWRSLYCVAWADFERFLVGWSPGHRKLHTYSHTQTTLAIPPY